MAHFKKSSNVQIYNYSLDVLNQIISKLIWLYFEIRAVNRKKFKALADIKL